MRTPRTRHLSNHTAALLSLFATIVCIGNIAIPSHVHAVTLAPGDIVASVNVGTPSHVEPALFLVDPTTGDRTVISDDAVGSGPSFIPQVPAGDTISILMPAVTLQSDGTLLVTVEGEMIPPSGPLVNVGSIFRVDPATGNRTIVSDLTINSGPASFYYGARESGSAILLSGNAGLLSVDPSTGDRSLFSGTGLGTGPTIKQSWGFTQAGNNLFVADEVGNQIVGINALTANRTVISSASVGTGQP